MKTAFADTVGLLALWDRSDQWHKAADRAFALLAQNKTSLFTTSFILLECANAAASGLTGWRLTDFVSKWSGVGS